MRDPHTWVAGFPLELAAPFPPAAGAKAGKRCSRVVVSCIINAQLPELAMMYAISSAGQLAPLTCSTLRIFGIKIIIYQQ